MIDFNNPSGPVMSSPRSLAALTSCAIAAFSDGVAVDDERRLLASLGIELTLVIVSVISDQPSRQPTLACQVRTTVRRTVPLADGETPVLIDQPEDALHAPWIEEYLVDRLRQLRGSRQYLFATRSPALVVSADSEQLITMRATAGRGEVEACGSLERHDLNRLALHHLEGGKTPLARRTRKLDVSLASERKAGKKPKDGGQGLVSLVR
ncbi:hypothetical protein BN13_380002 [Nostocoides jenkinsii Ben 74]|uniref:Uncharacterized protein n=1 Tax=Nostocoides jenkinsii Ben 74 TaxID=1193518 RepID=A0A077M7S9_9MICO|nr:hypothetical protein BN13_380002 [Tetrasphaera jenkinsii Ben 74]